MNTTEIWLLGIALAMDCLTVSIASGIITKRFAARPMLTMAFLFGFFQGGMLLFGYLGLSLFSKYLEPVDHWIAFSLLTLMGLRMIWESRKDEEEKTFNPLSYKVILTLAVATSIDALAVGISLACIQSSVPFSIAYPIGVVAFVSFLFTLIGLCFGIFLGRKIRLPMEAIGGCILLFIGLRILFEHLA